MSIDLIQVSQEKCIRCGICAEICPTGSIMIENQMPQAEATLRGLLISSLITLKY